MHTNWDAQRIASTIVDPDYLSQIHIDLVKAGAREAIKRVEFIITHLDSRHGFIKRLLASPDWEAFKQIGES